MFIRHVLSYGNAWARLTHERSRELTDITNAIAQLTPQQVALATPIRPAISGSLLPQFKLEGCWKQAIENLGWNIPPRQAEQINGSRHFSLRGLGYLRNHVSIALIRHADMLNRWLYTTAPLGTRIGAVEIPVACLLLEDAQVALSIRASVAQSQAFQFVKDQLTALSPLSLGSPFLILAISPQAGDISVVDLEREDGVSFSQIVVNRSIEFPAQYHQAGLGVLTYFGTVLREKYPDHNAKVRIEQDGLKVRMIIESENGDREIIERALQEYELVVRGEVAPDHFLPSATRVIELKNELRIAQLRIESQKDIIALQGETITSLRQLFGHSLSQATPPVAINFQPVINVSSTASQCVDVRTSVSDLAEDIRELLALGVDDAVHTRMLDLADALDDAADKTTPAELRDTSGISKLKSFLLDATTAGTKANEVLEKIEDGIGMIQNIGRKYNAIAEWCGAPQIPRLLLGKDA